MSVVNWGQSKGKVPETYRSVSEQGAQGDSGRRRGFDFNLVKTPTAFESTTQIEKHLPDILGRALARSWIDPEFREKFATDPANLLAQYDVFLPSSITIEYETQETLRPRIVVYEKQAFGLGKKCLLYLQLIMMAGK